MSMGADDPGLGPSNPSQLGPRQPQKQNTVPVISLMETIVPSHRWPWGGK